MIHIFPCLSDNYGFLLHEPASGLTASIDSPDGHVISQKCRELGYTLTHILNTHHHFDHVGGNAMLKKEFDLKIIGPQAEDGRIPGLDEAVNGGDIIPFGDFDIHVLHTPGHTKGHCAYYIPQVDSVFVGDTLFALGCGRLFEGTAEDMYESLKKLAALPAKTNVYCAHEYTLSNGKFALSVDADNADLNAYMDEVVAKRNAGEPTVPTTIAKELAANPFMRAPTPQILGDIRRAKDNF
ncbi:MAG TPA: hydroxyacylglutathione hydrolase [Hellea balneolensis]|uniref:Hydroxyacylglutathione hydrolase n=1 Tax=Hellea balneolensis TaxID=287478 RepID=A0A7C3C4X6_9PROT|nr:hydroxyacylglutathione hydrolase [Hellea balneolensis]